MIAFTSKSAYYIDDCFTKPIAHLRVARKRTISDRYYGQFPSIFFYHASV